MDALAENTVHIYSMPITLAWRLNYRLIELTGETRGEDVGVLLRTGEYRYVRWLGFIDRDQAKAAGKPVKLKIDRIGTTQGFSTAWEEVAVGKHVQGCMTKDGVYAVIEQSIRLV